MHAWDDNQIRSTVLCAVQAHAHLPAIVPRPQRQHRHAQAPDRLEVTMGHEGKGAGQRSAAPLCRGSCMRPRPCLNIYRLWHAWPSFLLACMHARMRGCRRTIKAATAMARQRAQRKRRRRRSSSPSLRQRSPRPLRQSRCSDPQQQPTRTGAAVRDGCSGLVPRGAPADVKPRIGCVHRIGVYACGTGT